MNKLTRKLKPTSGLSSVAHVLFVLAIPLIILVLVRLGFEVFAVSIVLLSKWRMFAVRPRYWLTNIRANLVDIFVGLSIVAFISGTDTFFTQVFWTISYALWLILLKPRSDSLSVMAQALIAQSLTIVAFFKAFPDHTSLVVVIVTWSVCYASARHFFGAFEESNARVMTHLWAWFGANLAWVLSHWSIEYLFLPQLGLILTVVGYGLATMYYAYKTHRLHQSLRTQLIGITILLVAIIIFFSDWQDKTL